MTLAVGHVGPYVFVTWLLTVAAAYVFRSKFFAIFVGILLGIEALVTAAMARHVGVLLPLLFVLHTAVTIQLFSLVRPRLRRLPFRLLISWPAYYYLGGALLAAPLMTVAPFIESPTPLAFQALVTVPFVLAMIGMVQSLTGRETRVAFDLDACRSGGDDAGAEVERIVWDVAPPDSGPSAARPLRLVQITDPHLGPFMSVARLRRISARAVAREPDLVLLTGDFLTMESQRDADDLAQAFEPLKAMEGRVFACFGNHDHEAPHVVKNALARCGVTLLIDDSRVVSTPAGRVQVIGADFQFQGRHEHLSRLAMTHPRIPGALRLWLLHDPGAFSRIPASEADLVLSGHTHGGQVGLVSLGGTWTFVYPLTKIPDHGLFRRGADVLYVHRGTGHYGFPLRLGVPSEQSLLEVTPPTAL